MSAQVTVGVDGSKEGLAAASWAARAAVLREVPLRVVHVEERSSAPAAPYPVAAFHAERSAGLLHDMVEQVGRDHPGLEVTAEHLHGPAADLLTAAADESDLTVLGSRGLGGTAGFLIGSVSAAVAGRSRQPVVLVRADGPGAGAQDAAPGPRAAVGEVLVGVDLRHPARPVLAFAFAEAARRGGTLRVLHGWSPPGPSVQAMVADPGLVELAGQRIAQQLAEAVRPWRAMYPGVRVTEEAVVGSPGHRLVEASEGAQLLVLGRRKRPAPLGPRLGHVAHAAIHHCAAPVAVVPVD